MYSESEKLHTESDSVILGPGHIERVSSSQHVRPRRASVSGISSWNFNPKAGGLEFPRATTIAYGLDQISWSGSRRIAGPPYGVTHVKAIHGCGGVPDRMETCGP